MAPEIRNVIERYLGQFVSPGIQTGCGSGPWLAIVEMTRPLRTNVASNVNLNIIVFIVFSSA